MIEIHQVYYDNITKKHLSPLFIPFDNSLSKTNEYEYGVMREVYNQSWDGTTHKGVVSWKFEDKIKKCKTAKNFTTKTFCDKVSLHAKDYDVIIINPFPFLENINVWKQGEEHHKGILKHLKNIQKKENIGKDWHIINFNRKTLCYCNYFVANKKFWDLYMSYAEKFYPYAKKTEIFPYIMERVLPCVLHDHQHELKILPLSYPKPRKSWKSKKSARVRISRRRK